MQLLGRHNSMTGVRSNGAVKIADRRILKDLIHTYSLQNDDIGLASDRHKKSVPMWMDAHGGWMERSRFARPEFLELLAGNQRPAPEQPYSRHALAMRQLL